MKQLFIDTNIIIDFLADRIPFSEDAAMLFQLAKEKKITLYVAAISFNNTYYILRKVTSHKKALSLLLEIEEYVEVIATDNLVLRKAMHSKFTDFEDAIQYFSALQLPKTIIICTRNLKDFKKSEIPVLSPETAVKFIFQNLGES